MPAEIFLPDVASLEDIDLDCPLEDHPSSLARQMWLKSLPGRYGGPAAWDLVAEATFTLSGFSSGFGWSSFTYPGGHGSIKYDGAACNLVCNNATTYRYNRPLTLSAWIYLTTTGANQGIITHGQTSYYLRVNSSNKVDFLCSHVADMLPGNTSLSAGVWYHVGATIDTSNNIAIYINGKQDATGTSSQAFNTSNPPGLLIGCDWDGTTRAEFFSGYMDGPTISTRVWAAADFATAYALGRQGEAGVLRRQSRVAFAVPSAPAVDPLAWLQKRYRYEEEIEYLTNYV